MASRIGPAGRQRSSQWLLSDGRHLGNVEVLTVRAAGRKLALARRRMSARPPNARRAAARDLRCSVVFEWASTPKWRKLTRKSSVGGQTLSRRQPVNPALRCSQLDKQARRVKSATSARFQSFAGVPGLRVGCRNRSATSRSSRSLRSRLRTARGASSTQRKLGRAKRRREPALSSTARLGRLRAFGLRVDGRFLGSRKLAPFHEAQVETISTDRFATASRIEGAGTGDR